MKIRTKRSYHDHMMESLKDRSYAASFLETAMEEGDKGVFLLALRDVVEAQGGMAALAAKSKLNRVSLYRMLSGEGNPELTSLWGVFKALGLRLAVIPEGEKTARRGARR